MKFFNTAGPVNQPDHYKIDPLSRWDLNEILTLIKQNKYFILHAPRQTGKTSSLLALQEYLNHEGRYLSIYVNFEVGQASRNDIQRSLKAIVTELIHNVRYLLKDTFDGDKALEYYERIEAENGLNSILSYITEQVNKPIVLLIDEIDSLVGDSLISVLRQLRAGYTKRPASFPSTVVLCGVRDIKDYRIQSSGQDIITGGSAFNIKAESLRLGNFSKADIVNLYAQHTAETGQKFEESCYERVMNYTDGQPWLVNALAYEVTYNIKENRDPSVTITSQMFEIAKERLILSRQTHLDHLTDKLKEDRVRRVILPMLTGSQTQANVDDKDYCYDLGLIKYGEYGIEIANQIYKEILPRELSKEQQDNFQSMYRPVWIEPDGSINVHTLLTLLKDFWNENTGIWGSNIAGYQEAAPQLITQAFLQRVANGSGYVNREYGLSRKRTDLMLKWQYQKDGKFFIQNIVMELKVIHKKLNYDKVIKEALVQTAEYAHICGEKEAHILIFDRDKSQNWSTDEVNEIQYFKGIKLEIWKFGNAEW
jgi:hypothetical protein